MFLLSVPKQVKDDSRAISADACWLRSLLLREKFTRSLPMMTKQASVSKRLLS
jgi:hypothetical protein